MKLIYLALLAVISVMFAVSCGEDTNSVSQEKEKLLGQAGKDLKVTNPIERIDFSGDKKKDDPNAGTTSSGESQPGKPGDGTAEPFVMKVCPESLGYFYSNPPCVKGKADYYFGVDMTRMCLLYMKWSPLDNTDPSTGKCAYTEDMLKQKCVNGYKVTSYDSAGCIKDFECFPGTPCPDTYPDPSMCPDGSKPVPVDNDAAGCPLKWGCENYTDPSTGQCAYTEDMLKQKCVFGYKVTSYDAAGCIVDFECFPSTSEPCPDTYPDPSMCTGESKPVPAYYDANGCPLKWKCENYGDSTTGQCPAISQIMPDCGDVKPEPEYDANGCIIKWVCKA